MCVFGGIFPIPANNNTVKPGVASWFPRHRFPTIPTCRPCDAAVFVTSVDAPMMAVETAFLADIRQHATAPMQLGVSQYSVCHRHPTRRETTSQVRGRRSLSSGGSPGNVYRFGSCLSISNNRLSTHSTCTSSSWALWRRFSYSRIRVCLSMKKRAYHRPSPVGAETAAIAGVGAIVRPALAS